MGMAVAQGVFIYKSRQLARFGPRATVCQRLDIDREDSRMMGWLETLGFEVWPDLVQISVQALSPWTCHLTLSSSISPSLKSEESTCLTGLP